MKLEKYKPEIEFMAWHKKYNKLYKVLHIHLANVFNTDWVTVEGFDIIEQKEIHIQIQPKDCVLLPYTNSKDMNNNKLYLFDVVEFSNQYGIIVFNKDMVTYGYEIQDLVDLDLFGSFNNPNKRLGSIYELPAIQKQFNIEV